MLKEKVEDEYSESESVEKEENSQEEEEEGSEEEWDDWKEDDADEEKTQSLFDKSIHPNPDAAISYDAEKYAFDLTKFIVKARLDDYGVIRLINYIRTEVAAGRDPLSLLLGNSTEKPWESDEYLKPILMEDPLLFHDFTSYMTGEEYEDQRRTADGDTKDELIHRLQQENAALLEALEKLRSVAIPAELRDDSTPLAESVPSSSSSAPNDIPMTDAEAAAQVQQREAVKIDKAYFDSYSSFNIHREMISDHPRTESYRQALELNPSLIQGKRVLDVGCGTGILSLFACRGGAARVVSVDGSDRMAKTATALAAHNGYSGTMRVLAGRLETISKLPLVENVDRVNDDDGKVDVVVSEWMGYALLFETMLDTVLTARDRFLRPGGAVLPDRALIYLGAASEAALDLSFWKKVYGFDFSPVANDIRAAGAERAQVTVVDPSHILSVDPVCVKDLDLTTMKSSDQDFTADFSLDLAPSAAAAAAAAAAQATLAAATTVNGAAVLTMNGDEKEGGEKEGDKSTPSVLTVGALLLWFDTAFSERFCKENPSLLSTSPYAVATHWAQTVLPLAVPISAVQYGRISGRVSMARSRTEHRCLDISMTYRAHLRDGQERARGGADLDLTLERTQIFKMSVTGPA